MDAALESATCLYTLMPDGHFLIDRHPQHPQVLIVSPCSGHGFKFTPVIGEVVSDLVATGKSRNNVDFFRMTAERQNMPATGKRISLCFL